MECDITFEKPVLKDMEEIARLLSSPAFYDENTHQLNFAAFNLRRFTNGEVECSKVASLLLLLGIVSEKTWLYSRL
jgi:hypothetical protein